MGRNFTMPIERRKMYKFPWSKADNPGAWVEVTDECDLFCPGCYRHRLQGHRDLEEVKSDVLLCHRLTNCSRITISGGEPLIYPHIIEVVDFISRNKLQPVIFTNGHNLSEELAAELKKAGLHQLFFHIDSRQKRPGWKGKTESDLNELRQHYVDMVWELGKVQSGINVTLCRETLQEIPSIIEWVQSNIHKVQNVSLIALRGLALSAGKKYMANGEVIDSSILQCVSVDEQEISITSEEIYEVIEKQFPNSNPAAYLSGTAKTETYKFLIVLYLGSPQKTYGVVGAKSVELDTVLFHLRNGRYSAGREKPKVGKKIFFLSLLDKEIRKAFGRYLWEILRYPIRLFDKIYIQCINIQQPNEMLDGEINLCDGCLNQMIYQGELSPSCKLDEYRLFGGPIVEIRD
jgi:pyruvate-formate lyase-activating enzyme